MKSKIFYVTAVILSFSAQSQAANSQFANANGTVLIAAPTALNGPTNQGIWFINPSDKSFSLQLPALQSNEVYEGWIVDRSTGVKISTGAFKQNGGVDSDAAGMFAGPLNVNFPPQPGSDFVSLECDISAGNYSVVLTIEPYPNVSGMHPAGMPILKVDIPSGAKPGTELMLQNISQNSNLQK